MKTRTVAGLLIACALALHSPPAILSQQTGSYQELYNQGLRAIYEEKQAERAIAFFERAHRADPNQWPAPFMVGYIYRLNLKQPQAAVSYLERASELAPDAPLPYNELSVAYAELGRLSEALERGKKGLAAMEAKGETPSEWMRNHVGYLYFKLGNVPAALETVVPGSGLHKLLLPKEITVRWPVNLAGVFRAWQVRPDEKVAITLPVDRGYQELLSARVESDGNSISTSPLSARGNRFLVLTRTGEQWPDQAALHFQVRQTIVNELAGGRGQFSAASESDPNYDFASDNGGGYYSQTDPEFLNFVARTSARGANEAERADILLKHMRANFRYGPRRADRNVYEILRSGSGDCGYYVVVAMGLMRARRIPARFLYGLNATYDPPMPHAVMEMYEAERDRWIVHDPQSDDYYGINNPGFVPFTAYPVDTANPRSWNPDTADGIRYVDTMSFFWSDSQLARRQQVAVRELPGAQRALVRKRSLKPPSGAEERVIGVRGRPVVEMKLPARPRSEGRPPFRQ